MMSTRLMTLCRKCCQNIVQTRLLSTTIRCSTIDEQNEIKTKAIESFDAKRDSFSLLIPVSEYRERQLNLVNLVAKRIGSTEASLLLIPAAQRTYMADTKIPSIHFKQNADFLYLTGLNTYESSGSILAILGVENDLKSILFAPQMTPNQVLWEGLGLMSSENLLWLEKICNDVKNITGIGSFIDEHLSSRQLFASKSKLILEESSTNDKNLKYLNSSQPLSPLIDELRIIKSENELNAMRRVCVIGANALKSTINWSAEQISRNATDYNIPLVKESQIQSKFDYETQVNGAVKPAYPAACAGAHRSTVIHYGTNNMFVGPDDWILMDAGCEDIEGYNSDITRCWPIGGDATQPKLRAELYEALCEVHRELIAAINEKVTSLDNLFTLMCHLLGKVLIEFNVIPKSTSSNEASRLAYKYCPHHVSHYLGLDVHDTPSLSRSLPIKPGMAFTVEPGLYFKPQDDIKKEFKGIGLRVEDDLCCEHDGKITILTSGCPQNLKQSRKGISD